MPQTDRTDDRSRDVGPVNQTGYLSTRAHFQTDSNVGYKTMASDRAIVGNRSNSDLSNSHMNLGNSDDKFKLRKLHNRYYKDHPAPTPESPRPKPKNLPQKPESDPDAEGEQLDTYEGADQVGAEDPADVENFRRSLRSKVGVIQRLHIHDKDDGSRSSYYQRSMSPKKRPSGEQAPTGYENIILKLEGDVFGQDKENNRLRMLSNEREAKINQLKADFVRKEMDMLRTQNTLRSELDQFRTYATGSQEGLWRNTAASNIPFNDDNVTLRQMRNMLSSEKKTRKSSTKKKKKTTKVAKAKPKAKAKDSEPKTKEALYKNLLKEVNSAKKLAKKLKSNRGSTLKNESVVSGVSSLQGLGLNFDARTRSQIGFSTDL